jgi:molybdate transport system regulatory protein
MEHPPLKLRIKLCSFAALGPGKIDLLEAIARCGSITKAAKDREMSYRRAWLLVDEMNRAFAEPVIDASPGGSSGGGARLTATGLAIIDIYRRVEVKAAAAIGEELAEVAALLAPEPKPPADHVRRKKCDGGTGQL